MNDSYFDGTLLVRQRSLPSYRVPLFQRLGQMCRRLVLITSQSPTEDSMVEAEQLNHAEWTRLTGKSLGKGVSLIYWQSGLTQAIRKVDPDVIITEANPRFADNGRLRKWASQNRCPLLGWGLGTTNFFGHGYTGLRHWHRVRTLARFDSLIAYGSLAKKQYCEDLGWSPERVYVAHNATSDVPRIDAETLQRQQNNRIGETFHVLTIGRLIANKSLELLLDASAILKRRGIPIKFTFVGDGSHRESLMAYAKQLGVTIDFPGHLEGDSLEKVASQADLFVLPGLGGLAIQQAMAFGLPVCVSEADGTEFDLVRSENGWKVPPGDSDAIAEVIAAAAADRPATFRMGRESLRIATEEINISTMASKMIHAVNESQLIKFQGVNR
ncbi:GDP-mannose-dependent alpha-(1-6)-phosphatidylinositol monomannoside mannosyltransferase [Rubripirellula tenax]|uniref:GDP-mannose-dependent alpha-(1-6)-phosphatidylinositol monomannoside mannosyltransferase n=1 Tax=Rubripirellula tenax TaxID=2528015 RepID=A0A5C6EIV1_9BACT|nr:glycosyltransferase family 4 protein [Rubripirellula tenax]TWU47576.1 GDP-mannose-dependent alpha-(1-6)-phosphatidylinositol monomannoside mannosyltransferase [Rubripirellula tenax]